ncbi:MAG TPA: pyridoxamine 5'-phosphate oxidase [Methylomirabilota bacterium]|nr:pyridoxamine 5'-phosphate oxidase [Methylomirabilota bacterium]
MGEPLPESLPADPLPLAARWLDEAGRVMKSATAMALATVDDEGRPGARMVICRGLDVAEGWLVFYTDRDSAKGRSLEKNPRAAAVFHWDVLERQIRVEGPVTHAPEADSDRYWSTRPLDARLAAVASEQSRPLASRAEFLARIEAARRTHGEGVPRPARWGGYRVWAERVELWAGQPGRAHDRAVWTRALRATETGFSGGAWRATRLQP